MLLRFFQDSSLYPSLLYVKQSLVFHVGAVPILYLTKPGIGLTCQTLEQIRVGSAIEAHMMKSIPSTPQRRDALANPAHRAAEGSLEESLGFRGIELDLSRASDTEMNLGIHAGQKEVVIWTRRTPSQPGAQSMAKQVHAIQRSTTFVGIEVAELEVDFPVNNQTGTEVVTVLKSTDWFGEKRTAGSGRIHVLGFGTRYEAKLISSQRKLSSEHAPFRLAFGLAPHRRPRPSCLRN